MMDVHCFVRARFQNTHKASISISVSLARPMTFFSRCFVLCVLFSLVILGPNRWIKKQQQKNKHILKPILTNQTTYTMTMAIEPYFFASVLF